MTALDSYLKDRRTELSELKQKRRKAKGADKTKYDTPIENLEAKIRRFMKSRMDPKRVGHIVINDKLYVRFLKKIEHLEKEITLKEDCLEVSYGPVRGDWIGKLTLNDISKEFEGYNIPEAECLLP